MNSNWIKIFLKLEKVKYGHNLKLKGIPIIINCGALKHNNNFSLGNNVCIKSSFLSNLLGLYQKTIIIARTPNAKIKIGNNVGISGSTIYARQKIIIGDNVLIGGNCKIIDNDFHPIYKNDRKAGHINKIGTRKIIIGDDCFIGCNSIILKGTILGNGCVVGAGSVVSGQFEDNCVIAGNPAKIIKKLDQ